MLLQDVLSEKTIVVGLKGNDKNSVIAELVEILEKAGILSDKQQFLNAVLERESLVSTAIGGGIAIPHAKHESVRKIFAAFGIKKEGVNFDSLDGKPVQIIILVAAPLSMTKEYVQIVARAARLLKSEIMFKHILEAKTERDVIKVIKEFDSILQESLSVETKEGRVLHKDI